MKDYGLHHVGFLLSRDFRLRQELSFVSIESDVGRSRQIFAVIGGD
jgi:hypothetical protein